MFTRGKLMKLQMVWHWKQKHSTLFRKTRNILFDYVTYTMFRTYKILYLKQGRFKATLEPPWNFFNQNIRNKLGGERGK